MNECVDIGVSFSMNDRPAFVGLETAFKVKGIIFHVYLLGEPCWIIGETDATIEETVSNTNNGLITLFRYVDLQQITQALLTFFLERKHAEMHTH